MTGRHCNAPGYPLVINTLGKLIDHGYQLATYCDVHGGQGWADLQALASKLGRAHTSDSAALCKHLPCPGCLRNMSIRVHPPNQPDTGGAHSYSVNRSVGTQAF